MVTGGAGFIGSHVTTALIAGGHDVCVIDDLSTGSLDNLPTGVAFHLTDVASPEVSSILDRFRPQALLHFAAQVDIRFSSAHPRIDAERNVLATLGLVERALERGLSYLGVASSGGAIYGEAEQGPQGESHPESPVSPYGVSKLAVDHYLRVMGMQRGFPWASMRFANAYGPRQGVKGEAGVVGVFAQRLRKGLPLLINGDGLQTRDFIHARDLARAAVALLEYQPTGVFNLGTGRETSILDLARTLIQEAGVSVPVEFGPPCPGEQRRSVLDSLKARQVLGWVPELELQAGLRDTWAWFLQRG